MQITLKTPSSGATPAAPSSEPRSCITSSRSRPPAFRATIGGWPRLSKHRVRRPPGCSWETLSLSRFPPQPNLPPPLALTNHLPGAQENLKILKQYSKLLSQACAVGQPLVSSPDPLLPAHAQPLSATPASYPRNLQWFESLSKPCVGLDSAGAERITQLLRLHAACDKSVPALPRAQAYELAKSLPHFDRDLTAYYLALPANAREYDLHVAHSILRLHSPADLDTLHHQLATWRNQGLLHVLSVAAQHMPELSDWFPVDTPYQDKDEEACSLHECLRALSKAPRDYARIISDFIAKQDPDTPTAQAIAATLDRLAILMSVKSNAHREPNHDLRAALLAFPHLESLEPQDVWARIKPALVRSLPPSLLRVDPSSSCVRKRVRKQPTSNAGTWYAPHSRTVT